MMNAHLIGVVLNYGISQSAMLVPLNHCDLQEISAQENTSNQEDIRSLHAELERIYSLCRSLKSPSSDVPWPSAELHSNNVTDNRQPVNKFKFFVFLNTTG